MTEAEWLCDRPPPNVRLALSEREDRPSPPRATVRRVLRPHSALGCRAAKPGAAGSQWADDDDPIALTSADFYLSEAVLEAMRFIPSGESERATLASVIRDIFGDPFRP